MSDLQRCLSTLAVATWFDNVQGIELADRALAEYLSPHLEAGTAQAALAALQTAYARVQPEHIVADCIRYDIEGRIKSINSCNVAN